MREIKFRAWDVNTKRMTQDNSYKVDFNGNVYCYNLQY